MKKIGILWLSNKVSPSQEHFLSEQIKQKISVSINEDITKTNLVKLGYYFYLRMNFMK